MAYRGKMTKQQEARMETGVAIFGIIVSIPIAVFGLTAAYSTFTAEKGNVFEKLLGGIGIGVLLAGGGIAGVCACAGGLKDANKQLKEGKKRSDK